MMKKLNFIMLSSVLAMNCFTFAGASDELMSSTELVGEWTCYPQMDIPGLGKISAVSTDVLNKNKTFTGSTVVNWEIYQGGAYYVLSYITKTKGRWELNNNYLTQIEDSRDIKRNHSEQIKKLISTNQSIATLDQALYTLTATTDTEGKNRTQINKISSSQYTFRIRDYYGHCVKNQ